VRTTSRTCARTATARCGTSPSRGSDTTRRRPSAGRAGSRLGGNARRGTGGWLVPCASPRPCLSHPPYRAVGHSEGHRRQPPCDRR
jgi:hypothetical protein